MLKISNKSKQNILLKIFNLEKKDILQQDYIKVLNIRIKRLHY